MNSLYDRRQKAVVVPYEPTSMKAIARVRASATTMRIVTFLKTRTVNQSVAGLCSTMLRRWFSARAHISASHRILSWSGQTDDYSTPLQLRHRNAIHSCVMKARKASSTLSLQPVTPNSTIRSEERFWSLLVLTEPEGLKLP